MLASPKFYFFDVGILNGLIKRSIGQLKGEAADNALEHYILMEPITYRSLNDLDHDIRFWRTSTGLEVDFILGDAEITIEVKISERIRNSEINGLINFQ